MGIRYATNCELRGRADPGKGCSKLTGFEFCALKGGSPSTQNGRHCTRSAIDTLDSLDKG